MERRGQVIRVMINLVNGQQEEPTDCGEGRQPLMDDTSRVSREAQARFCEGLGVQIPGATRPSIERRLARLGFMEVSDTVREDDNCAGAPASFTKGASSGVHDHADE